MRQKTQSICRFLVFTLFLIFLISIPTFSQEPIKLSTESEDIALTDDINIARAQVAKYPLNPEAHFNLAIALSRTSSVEEAIKELRTTKLLIRKPENEGTIDKKITEYKEIIKNNENNLNVNNIRYRLAFSHYLKAYLYTKELEKKEKNSLNKKEEISKNLFSFQKLSLKKENPLITENLKLSIHYFKELLTINPDDSWAKIYYAFIIAEGLGEINQAKSIWNEVLQKDPNNPAPHFFLGELHIKEGKLKEGIQEISQAILLRSLGY